MEEWKEYKLGEICEFQNGYAFKSTDFVGNGENRVVKIKELKDGTVKFFNDSSYITCNDEIKDKFSINCLDVLFALTGDPVDKPNPLSWVGRVSLYKYKEKSLMNQRVCKALPSEKIDNLFLYYYFRQSDVFYQLASKATGSASQANISTKTIADVSISLPPIQEQQKIVSILSSLDNKIEVNRKINENLEQQAQALLLKTFGCYKFASNESEQSVLPDCWNYHKLIDLCKHIKPGTNFQPQRVEKGIPFLNVRCINQGHIDFTDAKYISDVEYARVHKTWQPEENDLIISRIGTLGLVAVIRKEDLPLAVHYNFINMKVDKLPFEFMYFLLKSQPFQKVYHLIKKQSVQEYVTIDDVEEIQIPLPDINICNFNIYKDYHYCPVKVG